MEFFPFASLTIAGTPVLLWSLAFAAIIILGISKGGIKGISVILITMMVYVYGGKGSTAVLMPLLIVADLLAIIYYRKHVQWHYLVKLLPAMLAGVLLGTIIGKELPEELFKQGMIGIILLSVVILIYWEKYPPKKVPDNWVFSSFLGLAAGVTTMIGHLAGPFANIYFLSMRMPKNEFIGTVAWLFFLVNFIKLPIHIFYWKTVNQESFIQSLSLLPALFIGFTIGAYFVKSIRDQSYRKMIIIITGVGALVLLFK